MIGGLVDRKLPQFSTNGPALNANTESAFERLAEKSFLGVRPESSFCDTWQTGDTYRLRSAFCESRQACGVWPGYGPMD